MYIPSYTDCPKRTHTHGVTTIAGSTHKTCPDTKLHEYVVAVSYIHAMDLRVLHLRQVGLNMLTLVGD